MLFRSLYFDIMVTSDIYSNQPSMSHKWFEKRDWSSANMPLYLATLGALLFTIRVPFHLLCTNAYPIIDNARADLNRYYRDIILCIKQAEDVAIPLIRVRRNTQKPIWKCDPLLKKVKNKAKFWLRIWSACGRPFQGTVFI